MYMWKAVALRGEKLVNRGARDVGNSVTRNFFYSSTCNWAVFPRVEEDRPFVSGVT